jgi:hypothetical protein
MLLPQEIAEQLKPDEYMNLLTLVEEQYQQPFGVVSVNRGRGRVTIEIELNDKTRHEVVIH